MITVYTVLAIGGGVFLVVQLMLTLMGFAAEGEVDFMDDGDLINQDSTWFFNVLSLRSLVAALTFFGVGGRIGDAAGLPAYPALVFAMIVGAVAMVLVAWMMHLLINLRSEGTVHIGQAMGQPGSVYIPIPPHDEGAGKVVITIGNQTREYRAVSDDSDVLPTGASIQVVEVLDQETLKVTRSG